MTGSERTRRTAARKMVESAEAAQVRGLQTELAQERETNALLGEELLSERIAELEFALEDVGYQRLTMETRREFSRWGLGIIAQLCRIFYLKNPLVHRAAEVQKYYVFAQGMTVSAKDAAVQEVIQAFMDDRENVKALTGHRARGRREVQLQTDGQFYPTLYINPSTGRVRVRVVPIDEITEIITHPEDRETNLYYRRAWQTEGYGSEGEPTAPALKIAFYPDWRFPRDVERAAKIGAHPVMWDTPMLQVKVGDLADMRFGIPDLYPSIDWARAVKSDLEDYATIKRALARFAMTLTTKGGARGMAQAKAKFATTITTAEGDSSIETNPPPVTGSTAIMPEGTRLEPFRTAGALPSPEEGRRFGLMVAAAVGIPETILFGNADAGNLATAKTLDRPTEFKFLDRQTMWAAIFRELLDYAVLQAAKAPSGPEALHACCTVVEDEDGHEKVVIVGEDGVAREPQIQVTFPPLLEHDPVAAVQAIIDAATLQGLTFANGFPPKLAFQMLFGALSVPDADELLERMFPDDANAVEPYVPEAALPRGAGLFDQPGPVPGDLPPEVQPPSGPEQRPMDDIDRLKARADALGALIRAGFDAEDAARVVGLTGMRHLGFLPITVKTPSDVAMAPGDGASEALRALWRELSPVIERRRKRERKVPVTA